MILKNQINGYGQNVTVKITPDYISGLTQTDGSLTCSLKASKSCIFGIQFSP
jgi:hypothetical protein